MRIIHSVVIFNNGAWFSPKYLPSLYLGCIKNCVKVLADHEVDEIVVFDVGPSNTKELLYDLPKFTNVPISICGGINNIYDARAAISAGFDRVGVNITNKSENYYLLNELSESIGGSSCFGFAVLEDGKPLDGLKRSISLLRNDLSEILISSRSRNGSRAGLDPVIFELAKYFSKKNIAGNGGAKVEEFEEYANTLSAVAISAEWIFQGVDTNLRNFIIQGKKYGV